MFCATVSLVRVISGFRGSTYKLLSSITWVLFTNGFYPLINYEPILQTVFNIPSAFHSFYLQSINSIHQFHRLVPLLLETLLIAMLAITD